ncbi:MAG: murein transglycosylase A [Candidatus Nitricoxidivorans perseverans]|uniref:peptidoglycan lytic exotransglycosylase n=1 Tax=Candidatus Nitricoxidivorans perseverans TaxID=2975601 RepID=A0AA49IXN1_9PROT|nr:MAG: murein transglycosylase A [Candidatus Nitricoxidivorans perseverans]
MRSTVTSFLPVLFALLLSGCAGEIARPCPPAPTEKPALPPSPPLQPAAWSDLPGWEEDDPRPAFESFRASCAVLERRDLWKAACAAAREATAETAESARAWFEAQFRPWALVNPDGGREGLITGYFEPVLKGSRTRQPTYSNPVFGPPADMVVVDLAELYPELKHMRLRGRIEGRRLIPYFSRAQWSDLAEQEPARLLDALLWIDDPLDLFFMQIQGSGQVQLDDGTRVRLGYADQNGHPYRSIGRWLVDRGEMKAHEASMQNIKAWARKNPQRVQELLNANPSLVFFRELPAEGAGPPGALGVPLQPARSIAVDPRHLTLGAPVFLATTWPNDSKPLNRLMLAQDTGGAIRGVVRADFYWGSGAEAGAPAGRMRQKGQMWALMPRAWAPAERPAP